MVIYNSDGTPYQPKGSLNQFDPCSPVHDLLNSWSSELIEIGGSPIYYYEMFIQPQTMDMQYLEDRGKLWSPVPVQLYGMYYPITSTKDQGIFGIDSPDYITITFNYRTVLEILGHAPYVGSRLFTPHKRENWVIVQRNTSGFLYWGELYLELICERFQESLSTGEGEVTQAQPDFEIN